MPPFSRQVIDGCTRAAHGSRYIVNKQVTREDREAAVQSNQNGEMQMKTVIAIVGAIACFVLLLLGFWCIGGVVTSANGFSYGEPGVLPALPIPQPRYLLLSMNLRRGCRTWALRPHTLTYQRKRLTISTAERLSWMMKLETSCSGTLIVLGSWVRTAR
ncbi:hypothetical protein EDD16DRAFT_633730 [Pisolithus croceorrhizus]|nr:hypothetical protein EDD16DRAFT_633730 [Pisolithus croceorrhizus]KAI6137443.1 hypothetical protein EDD17DRAFT_497854 [Pisolithus thermaeus]